MSGWRALLIPPIPFGDFVTSAIDVGALPGDPPAELIDPVDGRGNRYEGRFGLLHRDDDARTATYAARR